MTYRSLVAILKKEFTSEFRTPSGLWLAVLFGVTTVFTLGAASFNVKLNGSLASGLLFVSLLFSAVVGLPRRFVAEEEYRTADLLRLAAHPLAVYWGKTLFSIAESCVHAIAFAGLFLVLTSMPLVHPGLLAFGLTSSVLCICGALSVCSAIAARSSNRMGLAIVIAFPLLVPIVFLGISCLRVAMGDGLWDGGIRSGVGLLGYGVCSLTVGQYLFTAVWKR